jgi:hypothetical protein
MGGIQQGKVEPRSGLPEAGALQSNFLDPKSLKLCSIFPPPLMLLQPTSRANKNGLDIRNSRVALSRGEQV